MRSIRLTLMLMLAMPVASIAASAAPDVSPERRSAGATSVLEGGTSQECCWIFYLGNWYCVPC